jgi:hypothetical protein
MDKDRETLWHKHWTEAKKAKAERREANRAAWQASKKNAVNQREEILDAVLPEVAIELPTVLDNTALGRLRAIMLDRNAAMHRRFKAAEAVMPFEISVGAGVNTDPNEIAAPSYRFFREVADTPGTPEAWVDKALANCLTIENSRKAAVQSAAQYAVNKELLRRMANGLRHMENVADGAEHELLPPGADFELPEGWANRQTPVDHGVHLERFAALPQAERVKRREKLFTQLRNVKVNDA